MKLSVIIPTRNRAELLKQTLTSLITQTISSDEFEVIVVDNGSTDNTKIVCDEMNKSFVHFKYCYEETPGLHVGRNMGARIANADLLSYLDDDVIVQPEWANSIIKRFNDDLTIVMVGGPCLPLWQSEQPEWLSNFIIEDNNRWELSYLSIINLGNKPKEISAMDVYGCNYSIRKSVLFELGGFRPDNLPLHLLKYRGDGESGLSKIIDSKPNMKVHYEPEAIVYHIIPPARLTREYFLSIAKRGAYGGVYSIFRGSQKKGIFAIIINGFIRIYLYIKSLVDFILYKIKHPVSGCFTQEEYWLSANWHALLHYFRIIFSSELKKWVIQESYFKEDWCPYIAIEETK